MSNSHPWCRDIARDMAIRAAEDDTASERPPLPDHRELPERVAALERKVAAMRGRAVVHIDADDTINEEQDHARLAAVADDPRRIPRPVDPGDAAGAVDGSSAADRAEVSGLRTERVTLEVTTSSGFSLDQWGWEHVLRSQRGIDKRLQSVRVVPSSEADAEVERLRLAAIDHANGIVEESDVVIAELRGERDAAIRERDALKARVAELESKQGDAEPVAWQVHLFKGLTMTYLDEYAAYDKAKVEGGTVVPLYRHPRSHRGWLTQDEVAMCAGLRDYCRSTWETWGRKDDIWRDRAAAIDAIVSRNSPPRVRLPRAVAESPYGFRIAIEQCRAALAAAGVEVGE